MQRDECPIRTEYVDREVEVLVPQKCIVPMVNCKPNGTDAEKVADMSKCLIDFIEAAKVCR